MRKSSKPVAGLQSSQFTAPHVGKRKSFTDVEARAREVLRDRGLTPAQIETELKRKRREQDD